MKIDFNIDHIDPLGQGVSKSDDRVTFIKKTLPGERGDASVISSRKGVQFAKLETLAVSSPDRIIPECSHFNECNGCDFLHTDYQNEKSFKLATLKRQLSKFNVDEINYVEAAERFAYRNRIQLHYDLNQKKLGLRNAAYEILEVPRCLIGIPEIQAELSNLYHNQNWINLVIKEPKLGHIELYFRNNKVHTNINAEYADGGFTQVNYKMNQLLHQFVSESLQKILKPTETVLDLFGGNGNLSKNISQKTTVVDHYTQTPAPLGHQSYYSLDLYNKNALDTLKKSIRHTNYLIIDPPRSGLKNLTDFIHAFSPQGFIYVSCQSTSFVRDTLPLSSLYKLESIHLFDLFPGTHHFETVGIFTRRKFPL